MFGKKIVTIILACFLLFSVNTVAGIKCYYSKRIGVGPREHATLKNACGKNYYDDFAEYDCDNAIENINQKKTRVFNPNYSGTKYCKVYCYYTAWFYC